MTHQNWIQEQAEQLEQQWAEDERWAGIERSYTAEQVVRLRGSVVPECTLARLGAERLWRLLTQGGYVNALGALTGGQAVQMVKAGLEAIYLSGWQVAADANLAGATYPDQSLYPANSVPQVVRRLSNALLRADQIEWSEGRNGTEWLAPTGANMCETRRSPPATGSEPARRRCTAGTIGTPALMAISTVRTAVAPVAQALATL